MRTTITITLTLSDDERERYEGIARARGIPLTRFIENALEEHYHARIPADSRAQTNADGGSMGFQPNRTDDGQ